MFSYYKVFVFKQMVLGSNPASTTTTSLFGKPTLGTSTLGGTTGSLFGNTTSTQLGAGQPSNEIKTLQSVILVRFCFRLFVC